MAARRKETPTPLVVLYLAAGVLLSPVLIPYAFWQHTREQKRKVATALRFPCAACGALLGQASLDRADAEWQAMIAKLHRDHPDVIFRLPDRTVNAICVACGKEYCYDVPADTFRPAPVRPETLSPALEEG